MKIKTYFLLFVLLQFLITHKCNSQQIDSFAQLSIGIPISFTHDNIFTTTYRTSLISTSLPALNNIQLNAYADSIENSCLGCTDKKYYGSGIVGAINIKNNAQYYNPNIDGGKLWILKLSSQTAYGFQFYFSKFILPDESFLHIYTSDLSSVLGPFTSEKTPVDTTRLIQFGTIPINGNEVYIEYYESHEASFSGSIVIDNVIHIFDPQLGLGNYQTKGMYFNLGGSAPCQKDAVCFAGWGKEINSTAIILKYDTEIGLVGFCTGVLLNNTAQDGFPYFLTAAHCMRPVSEDYSSTNPTSTSYDPGTWQFVFDYLNFDCLPTSAAEMPFYHQYVYGSSILAQDYLDPVGYYGLNSDYLLLNLNVFPSQLANMGVCYAGWSITPPTLPSINQYTIIHHPKGDVKKISQGSLLRSSVSTDRYSATNYYTLNINVGGGIQKGSSGAPIFNQFHKLIGTTTAYSQVSSNPYNPCDQSTVASMYFGRFYRHWSLGSFAYWLDPLNLTANPSYDGPSTLCPNPSAQIVDAPPINGAQGINQGIKINGKLGLPIFCSTDNNNQLSITPSIRNKFFIQGYKKKVKCSSVTNASGFFQGCEEVRILGIPTGKCDCSYHSYQIYITELDFNFSPVNSGVSRQYEKHTWTSGVHELNTFDINVSDVLGHPFVPGKYYSVGVANIVSGVWNYSSRIIYVLPESINISNNANVAANVYAIDEITIDNTNISNDIKIIASNKITILQNTILEAGEYFIDEINCDRFRATILNNNSENTVTYQDASYDDIILEGGNSSIPNKIPIHNKLLIIPNPNNGSFQARASNNKNIKDFAVYDIRGIAIIEKKNIGLSLIDIDISEYTKGIYYIKMLDYENNILVEKVINQ